MYLCRSLLDCCFSGAFGDLLAKDDGTIQLEAILGAEGRVVLTSSSSVQESFVKRDGALSIYTHYLVEGIRTGAADTDGDGAISVQELHHYASRKVQEESPAMMPKIIVLKDEGYQLRIANAPLGDPKVKYRKEAEAIVQEDGDEIDEVLSRPLLEEWQRRLSLTDADVQAIEAEVLEPIRQRQAKIQRYREVFTRALVQPYPLGDRERKRLRQLQQVLGLLDDNTQDIESEITAQRSTVTPRTAVYPTPANAAVRLPEPNLEPNPATFLDDDLSSEKGINYTRLRDLLQAQDWRAADLETYKVMIRAVDKKEGEWFSSNELLNFPFTDLKTIDRLWVRYSNGHFGFSIQKKIYVECGAELNGNYPGDEILDRFGDCVGWRDWIDYEDLKPSLNSPKGSFPAVEGMKGMKSGKESTFGVDIEEGEDYLIPALFSRTDI